MGDLPEQPILLTFDDGFYNNYSLALPLLEQYDMCAIVSVVGQFTDELAPESPHEDSYSYLTWEDLQALLDSGRVELGSHTYQMHSHTDRCGCRIQEREPAIAYLVSQTRISTGSSQTSMCRTLAINIFLFFFISVYILKFQVNTKQYGTGTGVIT